MPQNLAASVVNNKKCTQSPEIGEEMIENYQI